MQLTMEISIVVAAITLIVQAGIRPAFFYFCKTTESVEPHGR